MKIYFDVDNQFSPISTLLRRLFIKSIILLFGHDLQFPSRREKLV